MHDGDGVQKSVSIRDYANADAMDGKEERLLEGRKKRVCWCGCGSLRRMVLSVSARAVVNNAK
jgi:hypothetical protein